VQAQLGLSSNEVAVGWLRPCSRDPAPVGEDSLVVEGKTSDIVLGVAVTTRRPRRHPAQTAGTAAKVVGVRVRPTESLRTQPAKPFKFGPGRDIALTNGGHLPCRPGHLTPNYLKVIPTCPSWAGTDTYAYQSGPDAYTIQL